MECNVAIGFKACCAKSLRSILQTQLLELLVSDSCFYCFADPDLSQVQVLDAVNIPESTFPALQKMVGYDQLGPGIAEKLRLVMAYDVDFPRNRIKQHLQHFFDDYPQYRPAYESNWKDFNSSMGTLSLPDLTVGVGIHRLASNQQPFTLREIRILELISPSLTQTVRSLVSSEELSRYRSFADRINSLQLADHLSKRGVRKCSAGIQLYSTANRYLISALEREWRRQAVSQHRSRHQFEIRLFRLKNRTYRPTLTQIKTENEAESVWLLRMERATDQYSKLLRKLNALALTQREIEIAIFVRSGLNNKEIAARLNISYNTVRSHVAKIYGETGVSSQTQLVAFLNK